jgi:hypothetical protein
MPLHNKYKSGRNQTKNKESNIADFFNSKNVSPIKVLLWGTTFIALGFVGYKAYQYTKK